MFQIITVIIFLIYLALVYRFRKDNIILLLLTLIAILSLCNVKNITEGQSPSVPSPVNNSAKNSSNNSSKNSSNNSAKNSSNNSSKNSSNNSGPQANDQMRFIVSTDYQMGPYDGLLLTTDNPKSKYLKLNNVSLASKEDMCVYQGIDLPLDCKKTLYSGMGPSVTGVEGDDQNMFMFYRNKSSPECCPSTFSTSTGCVCTTQDQRDYITRRGMVAPKVVAPKVAAPKPTNSNQ
jgi:hypothetical protein